MKLTRTKHLLCLLSAAILLSMTACGTASTDKDDDDVTNSVTEDKDEDVGMQETKPVSYPQNKPVTKPETQPVTEVVTAPVTNPEPKPIPELPEVYRKYPNLQQIGIFHQGLAPFVIKSTEQSNNTSLRYGYIDIQGNVIIEPNYLTTSSLAEIESFENANYISVCETTSSQNRKILDKNGEIVFQIGVDGVSQITTISNGYFAVETCEEEFTGYVYSTTFYSAQDLREIYSIPNYELNNLWEIVAGPFTSFTYREDVVDENGNVKGHDIEDLNLFELDPQYRPIENTWSIDVEAIESFQGVTCHYIVSGNNNDLGQIATVVLINRDNICYYATVDGTGTILMSPQKNIIFSNSAIKFNVAPTEYNTEPYQVFNYNLCPAMDSSSNLWGYIDPYGKWVIQPQYSSATEFGSSGYATVDDTTIIDTAGAVVLSPQKLSVEDLCGTYTRKRYDYTFTLTISSNGALKIDIDDPYMNSTVYAQYTLQGRKMSVSGIEGILARPFDPDNYDQDGVYVIEMVETGLIINGATWTKVSDTKVSDN